MKSPDKRTITISYETDESMRKDLARQILRILLPSLLVYALIQLVANAFNPDQSRNFSAWVTIVCVFLAWLIYRFSPLACIRFVVIMVGVNLALNIWINKSLRTPGVIVGPLLMIALSVWFYPIRTTISITLGTIVFYGGATWLITRGIFTERTPSEPPVFFLRILSQFCYMFVALLIPALLLRRASRENREKTVALEKALERAEESDRLKSAFLANMSHEIRTPMNGILGFLAILQEKNLSREEKAGYIDIVNKSGHRLLDTINNIVEISRIDSGTITLWESEIKTGDVLKAQYDFFIRSAAEKGLSLILKNTIPENRIIRADRSKLDGILSNLIKNAIKFTRTGSVEIGGLLENGYYVFYVKDTGPGIPEDRFSVIFERFVQNDKGVNPHVDGSGLGLSLVKSWAVMMGGNIGVESTVGQGCTFRFTLPEAP